jgi:2-polyprenyl-3-methyl-5-hydroxy-6-metoxy-1,4-benzoquinol methylase
MKINDIRPESIMKGARKAYLEDVEFYKSQITFFQLRNCPGCRWAECSLFCEKDGFKFDRCPACWTIFMNPGPSIDVVSRLYEISKTYEYWAKYVYPQSAEQRYTQLSQPRADYIMSAMKSNSIANQSILEIGAGTGEVIRELTQLIQDVQAYAVEPNPDMWINYDHSEVNLLKVPLEEINETQNKFGVIYAFEVLEHLLNPELLFQKASSLLTNGGLLILSTPNSASIEVTSMKNTSNTIDIEHISIVTPLAIHSLANRHNFKVVKIETPGKFDLELMSPRFRRFFLKIFFKGKAKSATVQDFISKYGFSSHMKIVLQKIKD